ncbi:hypothetical protein GAYE_PCTG71G1547 [Galdieria yellowstonensis]|uniref:4Fe-4S ferredoxin-type domain-containing protein n=1 Tax=Galdieria yellowstonensis TaxID=3028027 RepID=A0AAV9I8I2_9RHOD|nr:hypothetical protein GAYE_PCTG71G1547 [Galdieria yellowstonensis]
MDKGRSPWRNALFGERRSSGEKKKPTKNIARCAIYYKKILREETLVAMLGEGTTTIFFQRNLRSWQSLLLTRLEDKASGLGFVGKNTMLIHPRLGSGFFLGEILTTVSLPVDLPPKKMVGCGKCKRCQVACPTGALDEDYRMDARKCISYLTIELKGSIPIELRPLMRNKIYGCDICQQVCPWNKFDWQESFGKSPLFGSPDAEVTTPKLVELIQMSEEDFRKRFEKTAVQRIGYSRLLRNVAVALGNSGDVSVLPILKKLVVSLQDSLVVEHLEWAINRLENCFEGEWNSKSVTS